MFPPKNENENPTPRRTQDLLKNTFLSSEASPCSRQPTCLCRVVCQEQGSERSWYTPAGTWGAHSGRALRQFLWASPSSLAMGRSGGLAWPSGSSRPGFRGEREHLIWDEVLGCSSADGTSIPPPPEAALRSGAGGSSPPAYGTSGKLWMAPTFKGDSLLLNQRLHL